MTINGCLGALLSDSRTFETRIALLNRCGTEEEKDAVLTAALELTNNIEECWIVCEKAHSGSEIALTAERKIHKIASDEHYCYH